MTDQAQEVKSGPSVVYADPAERLPFVQIWTHVLEDPTLSAGARILYGILRGYARQDAECWPGMQAIAAKVGVSDNAARRYMQELASAQLVTVKRRGQGRTNLYTILPAYLPRTDKTADQEPTESTPEVYAVEVEVKSAYALLPDQIRKQRRADPLWDALAEVCGSPQSRSEQADFGKTVSELRPLVNSADPSVLERMLRERRATWDRLFPGATFTHRVLRQHWSQLAADQPSAQLSEVHAFIKRQEELYGPRRHTA